MTRKDLKRVTDLLLTKHGAVLETLTSDSDAQSVFLLCENHSMPDLIEDNIVIATTLITEASVNLIGVEGAEGDQLTRKALRSPDPTKSFGNAYFAIELASTGQVEIVGVDSYDLFKKIEQDCENGKMAVRDHCLQFKRSEHMLDSMLEKLAARPSVTAAILNAGARHIKDIEDILIKNRAAFPVSVVRIQSKLSRES